MMSNVTVSSYISYKHNTYLLFIHNNAILITDEGVDLSTMCVVSVEW